MLAKECWILPSPQSKLIYDCVKYKSSNLNQLPVHSAKTPKFNGPQNPTTNPGGGLRVWNHVLQHLLVVPDLQVPGRVGEAGQAALRDGAVLCAHHHLHRRG